jgi:toxin-antitoxin system PIN domain toxin
VILVDSNLLLYAYNPSFERHDRARTWLEEVFSNPEPVGLAWQSILAFMRIGTSARAFEQPLSTAEATGIVGRWLELPMVVLLEPGPRHWPILVALLDRTDVRGPLVMDAHLAALAIEHGAKLVTSDRDFARFPGLRTENPLAA